MKISVKNSGDGSHGIGSSSCLAGSTRFLMVMLLLIVGLMAGVYWKTQNTQKPAEAEASDPKTQKEPTGEVAQGEIKIIKEKEVVTTKKEAVGVPDPKENIPVPEVEKEKTPVDLLLEKHFPLPQFKPLEEIVQNWQSVPKRALPEKILVNVSLAYSGDEDSQLISEPARHYAMPLQVVDRLVTLGHLNDPRLRVSVKMEDTDLRSVVRQLYENKKQEAIEKVLVERQANREKAIAYLAKQKQKKTQESDEKEEPKLGVVDDGSEDEVNFSAKRYGSKFRGDYWPSTKNGKNSEYDHEMPMGPIGGVMSVLFDKRTASIISLWGKGPGSRAGLEVGDVLIKVDGKMFAEYGKRASAGAKGVPEQLGMAILEAQGSQRPLVLTVKRKGESMEIPIDLPAAPPFKADFPNGCVRSSALSKAAAEYLLEQQDGSSGKWRANDYTNAWCGLALLATGEKKYAGEIKKLARTTAKKYDLGASPSEKDLTEGGNGKGDSSNWFVCINGIFLAEYYLATEDRTVLDALEHCCRSMDIRIHTGNGRFGHSKDRNHIPYGGKGLVIINVHAHLMWALESLIDGKSSYDWTVWDISYKKAMEPAFGNTGGVGYNFSVRGGDQSAPRTGAMLTALVLAEKNRSDARTMSKWLADNHQVFPNVHTMTFIGPIYGFMGLKNTNLRDYRKAMDNYQWLFSLIQPANYSHGAYYYGDRGNSGGDTYCKKRLVGNVMALMLMNSHRNDTLWMLGNREKKWFK